MIYRTLFRLLSPAGAGARLSTLIFHRVLPAPDPLFPDEMHASRFDAVCSWLANWLNVLPLDVAVGRLKAGTLPARAACITFDDGYADNCRIAMPILRRHGLTASFFIATGFLDGGRMWNDTIIESVRRCRADTFDLEPLGLGKLDIGSTESRRNTIATLLRKIKYLPIKERIDIGAQLARLAQVQLPGNLMMTSNEVKAMHQAGMQIGAHTVSHPILARLDDTQARHEIQESKVLLEHLLDTRIGLFAYPNGKPGLDYVPKTVEIVRSLGFDAAVSTQWGTSRNGDDAFEMRRFSPWDVSKLRYGARLLANLRNA